MLLHSSQGSPFPRSREVSELDFMSTYILVSKLYDYKFLNNTERRFSSRLNIIKEVTRRLIPGSNQHKEVKPQQQQLVNLREIYNKLKGELKKWPTKIEIKELGKHCN